MEEEIKENAKEITKEDFLIMKLYQSQMENQKLKIDLAKSKIEILESNYKMNATVFNSFMKDIYKKYDLKETDLITSDGQIVEQAETQNG